VTEDAFHIVVAFGPGADENETINLGGVAQGELLGNGAAHGETGHVGLGDALGIHQCRYIVGHHGGGIRPLGNGRWADAAVVDQVTREVLFVGFDVFFPNGTIGAKAHDQHEGRTFAAGSEMQGIAHNEVR
jgi:hypothetical protein